MVSLRNLAMTVPEVDVPGLIPLAWTHLTLS